MFCLLTAVKCLDFFQFFESQMMGSCLVSIHLTKTNPSATGVMGILHSFFSTPYHQPKGWYNWVSLAGNQTKWYTTLDTKRIQATRKTLDLHVPWQTLLAQLLYHQHPGSKISIPTQFFLSIILVHAWDQKRKLPLFKQPFFFLFLAARWWVMEESMQDMSFPNPTSAVSLPLC